MFLFLSLESLENRGFALAAVANRELVRVTLQQEGSAHGILGS
jgi:hypothetical protein